MSKTRSTAAAPSSLKDAELTVPRHIEARWTAKKRCGNTSETGRRRPMSKTWSTVAFSIVQMADKNRHEEICVGTGLIGAGNVEDAYRPGRRADGSRQGTDDGPRNVVGNTS